MSHFFSYPTLRNVSERSNFEVEFLSYLFIRSGLAGIMHHLGSDTLVQAYITEKNRLHISAMHVPEDVIMMERGSATPLKIPGGEPLSHAKVQKIEQYRDHEHVAKVLFYIGIPKCTAINARDYFERPTFILDYVEFFADPTGDSYILMTEINLDHLPSLEELPT